MDTTPLLLTIILMISTIFLVGVGIRLIFVLRDLRAALKAVTSYVHKLKEEDFLAAAERLFEQKHTTHQPHHMSVPNPKPPPTIDTILSKVRLVAHSPLWQPKQTKPTKQVKKFIVKGEKIINAD